jgi:SAM-dependent methyltransferase
MPFQLRSVLAFPKAYDLFGTLLAGRRRRGVFVREHVKPKRTDRVLDIGCGPASLFPHLDVAAYVGFDANPRYIDAARQKYGDRGTFICERVSLKTLSDPGTYDVVIASAILHHLDDEEARALFAIAKSALKPGGRLITVDPCYVDDQSRVARFVISRDRGEHVRNPEAYATLARETFARVHSSVRHDLMRIPYTHVLLECTEPKGDSASG